MQAAPGWYPDPANAHVTRYWDGTRYTHERHWNGTAWVDPPPVAPPVEPQPSAFAPVEVAPGPTAATPVAPVPTAFPPVQAAPTPTPPVEPVPQPAPTPAAAAPPVVAPPVVAMPTGEYPSPPVAPVAAAAGTAERPKPPLVFWLLVGGCVGVALAAFLPWFSVSAFGVSGSSGPRNGGPALLVILAAAIVAIAWPTLTNAPLSIGRKIGLIPIVGFLAIAVLTNWSDLSDLKDQTTGKVGGVAFGTGVSVDPGVGLLLYTVSVILLVVLVVRFWLSGRKPSSTV